MEIASYGAYGVCLVISVILLIGIFYVKGGEFVTNVVFYLLAVASFLSRDTFALTNDGGGKKSIFFYLFILLLVILTVMVVALILFGIYILIGLAVLKVLTS